MATQILEQNAAGGHNFTPVTGTGDIVRAASPTLTGTTTVAALLATTVNRLTLTPPTTGSTLTIADGKILTASNTITLAGTDGATLTIDAGGTVAYTGGTLAQFAATSSAQLLALLSNKTGTGVVVFNNAPTFVAPVLGACTGTTFNGVTINSSNGVLTIVADSTLATSGANSITLTSTGPTNVTLPNSGILATTAQLTAQIPAVASQAEVDAGIENTKFVTALTLATRAITDWRQFIGLQSVLNYSTGTWTRTRISGGDYVQRKTAAAETVVIGIDITPEFRTAASKGMKLVSFDGITRNNTADLLAHGVTLYRVSYTDGGVVTTTAIPTTGAFPTTQNVNPRVTNIPINTPAFFTEGDKYVIEITLQSAATSAYDFIGFILRFTKTN